MVDADDAVDQGRWRQVTGQAAAPYGLIWGRFGAVCGLFGHVSFHQAGLPSGLGSDKTPEGKGRQRQGQQSIIARHGDAE
jgi:hypothetical protein